MVDFINTEIVKPLWTLPDEDSAVPLHERSRRMHAFRVGRLRSLDADCEDVRAFCETWRDKELYRDFAPTWDAFCLNELQVEPAWVDKICEGLRLLRAEGEVGSITTREALARSAQALAADANTKPLSTHGGDRKHETSTLYNKVEYSGTSQAYLVKRLKRDAPDIAADLAHGKYPSARAAAKAAGIVRDPTPLEQLHKVWCKVEPAERLRFLSEMLTPAERHFLVTGALADGAL